MIDEEYNPGFAFYQNFFTSIENLPLEEQKEICYSIAKYGITGTMVDPSEMPHGYAFTMLNKVSIDESIDRWVKNVSKANVKVEQAVSKDAMIAQLIAEGRKSTEIAQIISQQFGEISSSAIRKSEPWIHRNDKDFGVKFLGKIHTFSQNCESWNSVNECEKNVNECENSQKICENSQSSSGEWVFQLKCEKFL